MRYDDYLVEKYKTDPEFQVQREKSQVLFLI